MSMPVRARSGTHPTLAHEVRVPKTAELVATQLRRQIASLIVASVIPLSMLAAFAGMHVFG